MKRNKFYIILLFFLFGSHYSCEEYNRKRQIKVWKRRKNEYIETKKDSIELLDTIAIKDSFLIKNI